MQQFDDELGITYSAQNSLSVSTYNDIMILYLESRGDLMPALNALLQDESDMPMAHCLRAYLLKLASDPRLTGAIKKEMSYLSAISEQLNAREQQHLKALDLLIDNLPHQSVIVLEAILESYPKDILAMRIAHHLHFYAGDASQLRDSVHRCADQWQADDLFYGFVLGMQSFGFEEAGDYEAAETAGRRSVEINPHDQWAVHAVTHVMHMQSRFKEGISWLSGKLPGWNNSNNFIYHLYWHQALFNMGMMQNEAALDIYDSHLAAALDDDFYLDVCNTASLLWRLEMQGIDVGNRWEKIQSYCLDRIQDDELVFCTLHYLMTPARLKNTMVTNQALAHFERWADTETSQGKIARSVGFPLARAIVEFANGEFQMADKIFSDIKERIVSIGGSHAQRHLFTEMHAYARRRG